MIPKGWKLERVNKLPFKSIEITAPNGYFTSVYTIDRNPENVLYMLADALLREAPPISNFNRLTPEQITKWSTPL